AYNEERFIGGLIDELRPLGLDILVVDDGSRDKTAAVAKKKGAIVLVVGANRGKGAALKRGFEYALRHNYARIITMDGDGQHSPGSIREFIALADKTQADIVIGNRMSQTRGMPRVRILTNLFMSRIISFLSGQNIPDTQCGFRLIRRRVLEDVHLMGSRYDMESEILIKAAQRGYRIESLAVPTIYQGSDSRIHPILDTLRFVRVYLRLLFMRY
ncbi:MAG: glycosyltransferase family 2 protein, partial [Candidatus Omnitrophota bacterium]